MTTPNDILGSETTVQETRLFGEGPQGRLPLTADALREEPSGNLFGMTQNVAMGWHPEEVGRDHYCIVSTQGGLRAEDGSPLALGYHTGHWEIPLLVEQVAATLRDHDSIPFAVYCSDPCDGRSQGTEGMFDSLPYRNDAAITMRRLIRSLPTREGVIGIGTCDKGLPAILMALAGTADLPGIVVPGGVTLPDPEAEDTAIIQTIGARFAHGLITLDYAAEMGCRACGSSGGGCQFLGTAATSQVIAEALGMALPHSALAPSGEPVWLDVAHRSALALLHLKAGGIRLRDILTQHALENAMLVHAAVGGSTNLLLHLPAIAHAAGLRLPTVADWQAVNHSVPRLVDVLPNGPRNHPTVQLFFAGAVPEVMLHLRAMGLLHLDALTVSGQTLGGNLDWWAQSPRRQLCRERLANEARVDPDHVIMSADQARTNGLSSTMIFPTGNIAPQGSVVKATAINPDVIGPDNVYRKRGTVRIFTSEKDAVDAVKGTTGAPVEPGHIIVLIGIGPLGTGMEETYQLTSALKYIPWGKHVPVITDGRFSGVSTGACIGHVGPEALAGGPIGKLRDGDEIDIVIDRNTLEGHIDLIAADGRELAPPEAARLLSQRSPHPNLHAHAKLPDDSRLWAALQQVGGGVWNGCVYDVDRIVAVIEAGLAV
ncbi:MAG TPA: YjhG/YagF family D-xylonate dehydratase [Aggregatilinea sp.]|uniref:YjhG/YagF family D-xylonate dehydratase n=1 Tax=Aggregatilinea sp. TaxID=2806333 RepID=UPI002CED155D|nr:YjhG/YagF family D-xylonate dehydratase [Aggregatilinea sp.]HML20928.1 YjhG/YagF family D-xylonate dehydratase [Aggregatilinea sp.]